MVSPEYLKLIEENGGTLIPHELLETMYRTDFSENESKIVGCIIRKTLGWKKIWDWISLTQFTSDTGILKPNVCRTVNKLLERNIIRKNKKKQYSMQMSDYVLWKPPLKKRPS